MRQSRLFRSPRPALRGEREGFLVFRHLRTDASTTGRITLLIEVIRMPALVLHPCSGSAVRAVNPLRHEADLYLARAEVRRFYV